jgi:hypothetical protein
MTRVGSQRHTHTNGTIMRYNDKHLVNLLHVSAFFGNFQGDVQQIISKQSVTNPSKNPYDFFICRINKLYCLTYNSTKTQDRDNNAHKLLL